MIFVVFIPGLSRSVLIALSAITGALVFASLFYLLLLLGAAAFLPARRGKKTHHASGSLPHLAVIIPAHNEEAVLAATLHSLRQQDYAPHAFAIVVVADNCTDATSEIARDWGAEVLERKNLVERGKGYALEWAFERLLTECPAERSVAADAEAYIIVDADTHLATDFLSVMARRLTREADKHTIAGSIVVLQGRYGVLNPQEGWRAALMTAAFDLCNHVRLQGAANLGLSVGLKGNGMAFSRALVEKARWQGRSITEDIDYGLDLLLVHNVSVGYEPAARVWAQMPVNSAPAASQRERWERGRYRLLRQRVPGLLLASLRLRRPALFVAAIDLMIPPLSELLGLLLVWAAAATLGVTLHHLTSMWLWVWGAAAASFVIYVLAGLKVSGADRGTFQALLHVPVYVFWKSLLYLSRFVGGSFRRRSLRGAASLPGTPKSRGQSADDWIRTERTPLTPGASPVVFSTVTDLPPTSGTSKNPPRKEDQHR